MGLFNELKRRNVFRVGIAYAVAAWLLVEASTVLLEGFGAPDWVPKTVAVILALGFPLALFFAWAFELTPEGLKRDAEVDPGSPAGHYTGRRLDVVTIVLVVIALGVFVTESWWRSEQPAPAAARTGANSVAVLPFANMSTDAENEYFADGISEEILNLLAGVRDLEVASRTSAFAFKGKDTPIPEIAEALGVRYVLEGSVRKSGERVRITAQLIDAGTDRHLWSETFDRTLSDIFAVQDEIARAIGDALEIELLGDSGEAVTAQTLDPALYARFLEARYLMRRRSQEALDQAAAMLEDVVAAEPDFAKGLTILAEAYLLRRAYQSQEEWSRYQQEARELAGRALELNPNLATAWTIQGSLLQDAGRGPEAYRALRKAIELEPTEPRPHHWLAILYSGAGYLDEGLASIEEAIRLEPDNANANGWRANVLMATGDFEEAARAASRQTALGNPGSGHSQTAYAHLLAGDLDRAGEYLEEDDRVGGQDAADAALFMAVARNPGDGYAAQALVDTYRESADAVRYGAVLALTVLGMHEAWLDLMRPGAATSPFSGINLPAAIWAEHNAPMRSDPRFIRIMEREGSTDLWRELGPPPDCRAAGDSFTCGHGYD